MSKYLLFVAPEGAENYVVEIVESKTASNISKRVIDIITEHYSDEVYMQKADIAELKQEVAYFINKSGDDALRLYVGVEEVQGYEGVQIIIDKIY